ncbi:hypothetical protein [Streptomyces indiaensis]|uniref:Uncharacterized protein n=1 Tax=Streptomyces indiaensis TaxID=284033 RepID=A0ABN3EP40_9ACTN|nr:hypothetical protein [Streptomyces indiaensis]MCF1649228.1 hypothetical protein [Streptomyces indiaensis]
MLLSSILSDPSETTVIVTAASSLVTGSLGTLTAINHKRVFAWAKTVRRKDEEIAELAGPAATLDDLYTEQCRFARTPSHKADLADITRLANAISGRIEHTECIRTELERVVECAQTYVETALPEPPATARIAYTETQTLMAQAMRQESARVTLERAINAANQKIATLRRI